MTEDFLPGDIVECVDSDGHHGPFPKTGSFCRVERVCPNERWIALQGLEGMWSGECFRIAFRPPQDEVWEPWNGGECPVGGHVLTDVASRVGNSMRQVSDSVRWVHKQRAGDVIAYRLAPSDTVNLGGLSLATPHRSLPQSAKQRQKMTIEAAAHGGYIVMALSDLSMNTHLMPIFEFAGSMAECLGFIERSMAPRAEVPAGDPVTHSPVRL